MGLTQQTVGTLKRQHSNENNSSHSSTTASLCFHCEKAVCPEDCVNMKPHLQKRSRDISPQRKPLGTMDMLQDSQNPTKKTEVFSIIDHRKVDTIDLNSLAQVVNAVCTGNSATTDIRTDFADCSKLTSRDTQFNAGDRPDGMKINSVQQLASTKLKLDSILEKGKSIPNKHLVHSRVSPQSLVEIRSSKFSSLTRSIEETMGSEGDGSSECSEGETSTATDEEKRNMAGMSSSSGSDDYESSSGDAESECANELGVLTSDVQEFHGIRPSLFDFVPPFINFCQHKQCNCLPVEVKNLLKWRLSLITPTVVRETVKSSGFRLLKKTVEWTGQWGKHMKAIMFRAALKEYQKINHLPATFQVGRKDKLWRNFHRHSCKFGKENFGFLPVSYILPQEMKSFKAAWDASPRGKPWIIKPPAGARGNGIRVINRWGQVPKKRSTIAQKYISRPFLINSRKFDIRLYVLVTSFHPMKIYIYRDGLVRFAPVKYTQDSKRVSDRFMHLTNYSINKHCDLYANNEDAEATEGHKWTLKSLWRFLRSEGHDVDELWSKLEDITIKTFICAEEPITSSAFNLANRYNGYELFGLDIILDEKLRPWLLEVNISPSLHSSSPLDTAVKAPLIQEVFNIVGYHFPDYMPKLIQRKLILGMQKGVQIETPVFDRRLYTNLLSAEEKVKQSMVKTNYQNRDEYMKAALQNLTPDDLRHLLQAEDELSQCNGFKRLFPSDSAHEYFKFLEGPRYYNLLLDAWEHEYGHCRDVGIKKLRQHCSLKMHLHGAKDISMTSMENELGRRGAGDSEINSCGGIREEIAADEHTV